MSWLKSILLLFTVLSVTLTFEQNGTVPLINKRFEIKSFGKLNWFNAHLSCLACGARLASIESEAEQNHIKELIRSSGLTKEHFWIAGTDLANEGIFNWFTTGNLVRYSNFNQGQPDNNDGTEHCILIRASEQNWNDWNCNNLSFFICENHPKCEID